MNKNGEILNCEQAVETIMRTMILFMDTPARDKAEEIMEDANRLRHKILELERL